jgi:hypothetical protein
MGIPIFPRIAQEGIVFSISDKFIDKIFLRMDIPINRIATIEGSPLTFEKRSSASRKNNRVAFFVTANFDSFGLKEKEMDLAFKVISHLAKTFSKIYIKIHPSDYFSQNDVYDFYQSLKAKNIQIVDNSIDAMEAIEIYKPKVVVGSMSTVLFDFLCKGGDAIFTYHLLPYIKNFGVYNYTLKNLNYNYVKSIKEITPKYQSNVDTYDLFNTSFNSIEGLRYLE